MEKKKYIGLGSIDASGYDGVLGEDDDDGDYDGVLDDGDGDGYDDGEI